MTVGGGVDFGFGIQDDEGKKYEESELVRAIYTATPHPILNESPYPQLLCGESAALMRFHFQ